jgi:D-amino-acid oxidase
MSTNPPVTIIGCGVIGLSCGIACLEKGWGAEILARDLPPHTDSNKAGAVWFPFKAAPQDLVCKWSAAAYQVFVRLALDPGSGVNLTTLFVLSDRLITENPWWLPSLPGHCIHKAKPDELPPGYTDGFALQVPMVETDKYLDYLINRFRSSGGVIKQQELHSLDDLDRPLVINCPGLGAHKLVQDPEVFPISGHIVVVKEKRPLRCLMDEYGRNALAYVFPRPDVSKLGGTAWDHDWNEDPDPYIIESILARCLEMEPALADAEVVGAYKGLRPGRREVRLEKEIIGKDRLVIHNYGHGGSGYTMSWGCAQEAVEILISAL